MDEELRKAVEEIDGILYSAAGTYEMGYDGGDKAWDRIRQALGMAEVQCQARAENWGL